MSLFTFPCFFFFLFLFILLSHLICCGHVFVSRAVARTLVFSLISFVSESQMSIYIMMEWNEMRYSRAFLILFIAL